jgi:hypothetical protein
MKIYFNTARKVLVFLSVGITFICVSCYQDVIDIDLSQIDKQIVIEGIITDRPSTCIVKISETSSIYRTESTRKISDAIVTISDDQGNTAFLSETEPGIYKNNSLIGSPGRKYTMEVQVNGNIYTAVSQMPVPLVLDSVAYNLIYPPVYVLLYFTDHKEIHDFCRIKIYKNHVYLENEKILYYDKYTDGEIIEIDNIDELFNRNDLLKVDLVTIDKNIYDFYSVVYNYEDPESAEESVIDLASANPKSNISNNALGYFSAQTVRSYSVFIR